jgi:vitamin B12 transporter
MASDVSGKRHKSKMKKSLLVILYALISGFAAAQSLSDTTVYGYVAPEVKVSAEVSTAIIRRTTNWDYLRLVTHQADLGKLLEEKGLAVLNVTGAPGASASARFRGMGSDHSVFSWHGVPLNSVSLGTCDVSLIPVFLLDNVMIHRDPSASEMPATGLGLSVNMNSNFNAVEDSRVKVISSYNSLRNSFIGADVSYLLRSGNENQMRRPLIKLRSRIFDQEYRNEFKYVDTYHIRKPQLSQHHNNGESRALMQDVFFKWQNQELSAHAWIQKRNVALPAIMGKNAIGTAEQFDDIKRFLLSLKHSHERFNAELTSALLDESMHYRDLKDDQGEWYINSAIRSLVWFNSARSNWQIGKGFTVLSSATYAAQKVSSVNYIQDNQMLNFFQLAGGARWKTGRHGLLADARFDSRSSGIDPIWMIQYDFEADNDLIILNSKVSASSRQRFPDMNELFWSPGGNRSLLPETGLNYSAVVQLRQIGEKRIRWSCEPSFTYADVANWIQWIPGENNIWSPVNYKKVVSRTTEVPINVFSELGNVDLFCEIRYVHTHAQMQVDAIQSSNNQMQMIYTPQHVVASCFSARYRQFEWSVRYRYTSERFTEEQNLDYRSLPEYQLLGTCFKAEIPLMKHTISCSFDVENILNTQYQSVRAYAMPGRVYTLTVSFSLNQQKNENT